MKKIAKKKRTSTHLVVKQLKSVHGGGGKGQMFAHAPTTVPSVPLQ
jgi:hypothetical protein